MVFGSVARKHGVESGACGPQEACKTLDPSGGHNAIVDPDNLNLTSHLLSGQKLLNHLQQRIAN